MLSRRNSSFMEVMEVKCPVLGQCQLGADNAGTVTRKKSPEKGES